MLELLGLDSRSEAVYRCMLARPGSGISAIAEATGLLEQEVCETLDSLSGLALVHAPEENGTHFRAVSPELGLEFLLARQQAELAVQQSKVQASRAAAAKLIAQYAELHPSTAEPSGTYLVGIDAIREKLAVLSRTVRRSVMCFAPNGGHSPESLLAAKPLDQQLLARGVQLRTIYLDSVRNSPHTTAYAEWLASEGGEVRTAPSLPVRMIIMDEECAVIPTKSENTKDGAVVLRGQGTLAALCALFESVWSSATVLGAAPAQDAYGLTTQEREVLDLLYRGLTDEAIAKRLGVSARTARRVANNLMDRLGSRSRFQAGAMAVQRQWLPPQPAPTRRRRPDCGPHAGGGSQSSSGARTHHTPHTVSSSAAPAECHCS
ncbi:LuxR C-terminal-related transcriptional regulator [Streptomyces caniferus]|uniref:LuxR C-terminal-related transcriptional regulator n=1 Tax=Streptomyces caniferus TaxID=285557 RepID=UPI0034555544